MKMTGDHHIGPLSKPLRGIPFDQGDRVESPCVPLLGAAVPVEETGDPQGRGPGEKAGEDSHRRRPEEGSEETIPPVVGVDLIPVAEVTSNPVERHLHRPGENLGTDLLRDDRTEIEVVVPLQPDDPHAGTGESSEPMDDRTVRREKKGGGADPEVEEIPQDDERVDRPFTSVEELEQTAIIPVCRFLQVSIGNKCLAHGGSHYNI